MPTFYIDVDQLRAERAPFTFPTGLGLVAGARNSVIHHFKLSILGLRASYIGSRSRRLN